MTPRHTERGASSIAIVGTAKPAGTLVIDCRCVARLRRMPAGPSALSTPASSLTPASNAHAHRSSDSPCLPSDTRSEVAPHWRACDRLSSREASTDCSRLGAPNRARTREVPSLLACTDTYSPHDQFESHLDDR